MVIIFFHESHGNLLPRLLHLHQKESQEYSLPVHWVRLLVAAIYPLFNLRSLACLHPSWRARVLPSRHNPGHWMTQADPTHLVCSRQNPWMTSSQSNSIPVTESAQSLINKHRRLTEIRFTTKRSNTTTNYETINHMDHESFQTFGTC